MSKADIRKAFLDAKPKSKILTVFGIEVELRQQVVGSILGAVRDEDGEMKADRATAFAHLIISCCYVPGTEEKVFDEADTEVIKTIPFGPELIALQNAVNELMGVDVKTERKN